MSSSNEFNNDLLERKRVSNKNQTFFKVNATVGGLEVFIIVLFSILTPSSTLTDLGAFSLFRNSARSE